MRYEKELKIWNARYFMIQDNVMNGNELSPPSTVYITLRLRLALIERKLMKPILRRNKFVQPLVSIGYAEYDSAWNILTCRNVSRTCKVSYRVAFWLYEMLEGKNMTSSTSRFEDSRIRIFFVHIFPDILSKFLQTCIKINKQQWK